MKPSEAYELYMALKLHFTSPSYDFIKYHGQLKKRPDYRKLSDKFSMVKFSRHPDPKNLAISNMVKKPKIWVRDLLSDDARDEYTKYQAYMAAPEFQFKADLAKLDDQPMVNFRGTDFGNDHPLAMKRYLGGKISPITLCILNKLSGNLFDAWTRWLKHDIVVYPAVVSLQKFAVFVNYDNPKYLEILKERFNG